MFKYDTDEGLSGPKTRQWLTLFGGIAIGSLLPKMTNYFIAKGMPPDQAKATADAVIKGTIPAPPDLEAEAARAAALEQAKKSQSGIPAWAWPVGIAIISIAFLGGRMRRNPPRRRRRG